MGLIRLFYVDPALFFILAFVLLYSVILHETAHGAVALLMGDPTARREGRLTLNPFNHVDPLGAMAVILIGFGWAKPVPVNPLYFRNRRLGLILVSLAGPAANVLIATAALFVFKMTLASSGERLVQFLLITARINIMLAAFNLIPIPPLDGSRLLTEFLVPAWRQKSQAFEMLGIVLLFFLILTGSIDPVLNFLQKQILALISLFV